MNSAVDIVERQIEAYVAGDAPRFAALYALDAVCENLTSGEEIARGREAIERVWGALFQRRRARFELVNRLVLGNVVVDHEKVINTDTGAVIEAIAAYEVRDELIQRVWFLSPAP